MGPNKATNRNPVISTLILILTIYIEPHKLTLTFELRIIYNYDTSLDMEYNYEQLCYYYEFCLDFRLTFQDIEKA